MKQWIFLIAAVCVASCGGGGSSTQAPVKDSEAAGIIDTAFGEQGVAVVPRQIVFPGATNDIVELEAEGYLVGGRGPYVAKLTVGGQFDPAFASGGVDTAKRTLAQESVFNDRQETFRMAALPANRIAVVEWHGGSGCGLAPGLVCSWQVNDIVARRIDALGNLDISYGNGGLALLERAQHAKGTVVVSPSGRVTSIFMSLIEHFMYPNAGYPLALLSLDSRGIRDPAFEANALASLSQCGARFDPPLTPINSVSAAALGDRIVVATGWGGTNDTQGVCVSRLEADGRLDATFATSGFQTFAGSKIDKRLGAFRVLPRADGEIVVALNAWATAGAAPLGPIELAIPPVFLFLTAAGAKDPVAATEAIQVAPATAQRIVDVALQANGKIVLLGVRFQNDALEAEVWRATPNAGAVDYAFGPAGGGHVTLKTPEGGNLVTEKVFIDRNGAIFVPGYRANLYDGATLRLR